MLKFEVKRWGEGGMGKLMMLPEIGEKERDETKKKEERGSSVKGKGDSLFNRRSTHMVQKM